MEKLIKEAKTLNPEFENLTIQKQYEFIKEHIYADILYQELEWYYNSAWGSPYDTLTLIRKANANKRKLETPKEVKEIKFNFRRISGFTNSICRA